MYIKTHRETLKTQREKLCELTWRTNETARSIEFLAQTQMRINKSDLHGILSEDLPDGYPHKVLQQSDLSRAAQRPTRISSASSSSHPPASSNEGSDLSASSSASISTNSEGGTQQHDNTGLSNSSNFNGMTSMNPAYYKPFQIQMSDRSDRDSDGAQGVDPIPATANDDDDDRASIHTITQSTSQHSLNFPLLRPSHRDNPESHREINEPEGLREFREVHHRITQKYRQPKY